MTTALLVIDMQMGMARRIAEGRPTAVPEAESNMAALIALFRSKGRPVVHVHHDDPNPASPFRRGTDTGAPMPCALPHPDEALLWKSGSSAFAGTGLDAHLRRIGAQRLVIIGAVAAFCVTSTVRSAYDLGFEVILPQDALLGFDLPAVDTGRLSAQEVLRVTLSILGADFAQVLPTSAVSALL